MKRHKAILVFLCACMLCGCTQKNVVQNDDMIIEEPEEAEKTEACEPKVIEPREESIVYKEPEKEPEKEEFVEIRKYVPGVYVELKYATDDNFTGQKIYDFTEAYLRYGTVQKLQNVQKELEEQGLSLKIWDAFRPVKAQFSLWEVCPNPTYVANPKKGFSSHSKGNTLDVTIIRKDGEELEMPTGFDDFSRMADRDYSDCTKIVSENAQLLEDVMKRNGFEGYYGEWWHFSDTESYSVDENFVPAN